MTQPAGSRRRTAVLISGRGSNMRSLVEAATAPDYPAAITLVLSNRPEAAGLAFAADQGIANAVIPHADYATRDDFDMAVDAVLRDQDIDLVCLAGFMRLLTPGFVALWRDRLINIHPSLLPAFKGLNTHRRVLDAGVRIAGCTVHFVRPDMDAGPIIAQAAVPVLDGDTEDALAARVLRAEHRLYPMALADVASGRARIVGERVLIGRDEDIDADDRLMVPRG